MIEMDRVPLVLQMCMLIWVWSTCTATALTLEQQVKKLENLVEKNSMEMKAQKRTFEAKIDSLETKVEQLEEKVQEHESLLLTLRKEQSTKSVSKSVELSHALRRNSIHRTCREIRAADPSLPSGMYWVDPDGDGIGHDSIHVYCNMTSGSTSVLHDSESKMDVGNCAAQGCYSRQINYYATTKQMTALAELSGECRQSIRYDCISAPFKFNGVAYSWWNDKHGNPQHFWAGNNASAHTCQCGIDRNCYDASMTCNCNSKLDQPKSDSGIITDKTVLPITRLNFGRTTLKSSSGAHTLGRFECTGQAVVTKMPTSCADLKQLGHILSGIYSIKGSKQIEAVYCDFTKRLNESKLQTWIGYSDVQSSPTYFYVQNSQTSKEEKTPILFDTVKLNIGEAMDISSGVFTAPRTGRYSFFISAVMRMPSNSGYNYLDLGLNLNGKIVGKGRAEDAYSIDNQWTSFSFQSTVSLQAKDKIWLETTSRSSKEVYLVGGYTHFTGWLLQEDIF